MRAIKSLPFLSGAENRESFFRRIKLYYPTLDPRYQAMERAYNTAKDVFRGTLRDDGERYFEHLRAVTLILIVYLRVIDHEMIIAALLHDLVEDFPHLWSIERVRQEFGQRVAYLVEYLTKPSKDEYPKKEDRDHAYHSRFAAAPREFFLIKLADRWHNLLTLGGCPKEKQVRKVAETVQHYLPHAEKHGILLHEIEAALKALAA